MKIELLVKDSIGRFERVFNFMVFYQIPIFETRSDGRDNFIGSLIMAGCFNIPEVTVFFNNKLFRGNRTTKVSAGRLNAFDSPNFEPLAIAGVSISGDYLLCFSFYEIPRKE